MPIRLAFVLLSLTAIGGCSLVGAPERASDTQNPNAISDDIAALSMTRCDACRRSNGAHCPSQALPSAAGVICGSIPNRAG